MKTIKTIKTDIRAAVMPKSYNEEKKTFDVTFTTSAPVVRYDWMTDTHYNEVLSFDPGHVNLKRLNNGAPVLDNHNRFGSVTNQIGVVERAWVENGQGGATIRFSNREDVQGIVQDVKDGILKNVSIGYTVRKMEPEQNNEGEYPIYRAIDWEPFEISLVTVPADAAAQVRGIQESLQSVEIIEKPNEVYPPEGVTPITFKEENKDSTAARDLACLEIFLKLNM